VVVLAVDDLGRAKVVYNIRWIVTFALDPDRDGVLEVSQRGTP
jgi:hypothetical protein